MLIVNKFQTIPMYVFSRLESKKCSNWINGNYHQFQYFAIFNGYYYVSNGEHKKELGYGVF